MAVGAAKWGYGAIVKAVTEDEGKEKRKKKKTKSASADNLEA
jgi:hypothetical protein